MNVVDFLDARLSEREDAAFTVVDLDDEPGHQVRCNADDYRCDWTAESGDEHALYDLAREHLDEAHPDVVAMDRGILAEHLPRREIVEWAHDRTGRGRAWTCPRCQNAEHSEWYPEPGKAGRLPPGFVTPYVLAPCRTLRLLAAKFRNHPDYDQEWTP